MNITITPNLLSGSITPPPSKSQAHRLLIAAALRGDGDTARAAEEIKLRSRQYAKRQLTWFRRNGDARWIRWETRPNFAAALQTSTEYMEEFGIV